MVNCETAKTMATRIHGTKRCLFLQKIIAFCAFIETWEQHNPYLLEDLTFHQPAIYISKKHLYINLHATIPAQKDTLPPQAYVTHVYSRRLIQKSSSRIQLNRDLKNPCCECLKLTHPAQTSPQPARHPCTHLRGPLPQRHACLNATNSI